MKETIKTTFLKVDGVQPFLCCYLMKYFFYCKVGHLAPFRSVAAFFSAGIYLKCFSIISASATSNFRGSIFSAWAAIISQKKNLKTKI